MTKGQSVGSSFGSRNIRILFPVIILLSAMIATIVIAACGSQSSSPSGTTLTTSTQQTIPKITIKAVDFSFQLPQTVSAGLVDVTLVNNGSQPHQTQFARINNGNFDEFKTTLDQKGPGAALGLVTLYGGVNTLDPGQSGEAILNLPSGQYASICFVSGADNVPHYMKGMITHFSVTGSSNGSVAQPESTAEIMLKDFTFVLPNTIPSGPVTLKVTNQGPQPHELDLLKLAQGKTLQDAKTFLNSTNPAGPPPFTDAGGMGALAPGSSAWLKLSLQPGNHVAICFVPDIKTGKPHFMLGMISSFTVA